MGVPTQWTPLYLIGGGILILLLLALAFGPRLQTAGKDGDETEVRKTLKRARAIACALLLTSFLFFLDRNGRLHGSAHHLPRFFPSVQHSQHRMGAGAL